MKALPISILFAITTSGAASAWEASVEGPDVFDKVTVIASETGLNDSLVVQCDSESELFIAYIFRKKEFEETPTIPAKLFLKWGDESPLILEASHRNWNNNFGGVVASGRDENTMKAISGIRDAKGKIQVGFEVVGNRISASFSSRGSKKPMTTIIEKCRLK